jgi:YHS domain-containing protein
MSVERLAGYLLKVMCNQCGKILDLMTARSVAVEESGQLKTYNFCSEEHMADFARRKGIPLGKD